MKAMPSPGKGPWGRRELALGLLPEKSGGQGRREEGKEVRCKFSEDIQ